MAARSHELAWVAALLESLPPVELLDVEVASRSMWVGNESVPSITLRVQAGDWTSGNRLADAMRLREGERRRSEGTCMVLEFRSWSGWAAEGSREAAVWVEITAGEEVGSLDGAVA